MRACVFVLDDSVFCVRSLSENIRQNVKNGKLLKIYIITIFISNMRFAIECFLRIFNMTDVVELK